MPNKNYIQYDIANNDSLITWTRYKDVAGPTPEDGLSGSPSILFQRNPIGDLKNIGDFVFSKPASNCQGEGVSNQFIIEPEDKQERLFIVSKIKIDPDYADDDLAIFVYSVDDSQLITPNYNSIKLGQKELYLSFTASNSLRYRLIIHCASTNALAFDVAFGSFFVGKIPKTNFFVQLPVITSNITVDSWNTVVVDSTAGSFTVTLPASPKDGDEILFIDKGGVSDVNPITINGNGKNINESSDPLIFDDVGTSLKLLFNQESDSWLIIRN